MKRNNKKGFTIVELVIVIAVIAILAGVLIPTFSGVVKKAQESAAIQEATNAYKEALALALANDGYITAGETAEAGGFTFSFATANSSDATTTAVPSAFKYQSVSFANGKATLGAQKS